MYKRFIITVKKKDGKEMFENPPASQVKYYTNGPHNQNKIITAS